jgi:hypothetical protein
MELERKKDMDAYIDTQGHHQHNMWHNVYERRSGVTAVYWGRSIAHAATTPSVCAALSQ